MSARHKNIIVIGDAMHEADSFSILGVGGDAADIAIGAARLNAVAAQAFKSSPELVHISVMGAIGSNSVDDELEQAFGKAGVSTKALLRGSLNRAASYDVSGAGRITYRGRDKAASRDLFAPENAEFVNEALKFANRDTFIVVTGNAVELAVAGGYLGNMVAALEEAKKNCAHIVLDADARPELWGDDGKRAREVFKRIAPLAETVLLSETDARQLFPTQRPDRIAAELRAAKVRHVVFKKHNDYSLHFNGDGKEIKIPAFTNGARTDSTGMGDAFTAGMIIARAHGVPMDEALTVGARAAAQVADHPGSVLRREHLPDAEQLESDIAAFRQLTANAASTAAAKVTGATPAQRTF
jgi:sugar/nucleoside kinase (ribokinase family)